MGLLCGLARTAVIAGTATAVSNRVSRRQARRWAARDQGAADEQYYAGRPYPPSGYTAGYPNTAGYPDSAAEPDDDMSSRLDQLKQLGDLKAQGLLTEAEFARQKDRILGG